MVKQSTVHQRETHRILILLLAAVMAVGAITAISAQAGAQEPMADFRILKLDCAEDPGRFPDGLTPEGCTPGEGVEFSILVDGTTEPVLCTTNAEGRCTVQLESESMVTVTEDESTATAGYTPRENPIETQVITEFAGAIFVNVKDDEPTTELPDTGAGALVQGSSQGAAGTFIALATLLAASGIAVKRSGARLR